MPFGVKRPRWIAIAATVAIGLSPTLLNGVSQPALAAPPPVLLGTAASFAVLAGQSVTNTGPSVISGDIGVSPGSSITGFPPGVQVNGVMHVTDAVAAQAQIDLTTAYNDAAGRPVDALLPPDASGLTLAAGVYQAPGALGLTGTLTLDAAGDPSSAWIVQIGSTLITGPGAQVALINGADPCNVFWQVGSSATLDVGTDFVGTIMALTSITLNTGATLIGRALARNGSVTLDDNTITVPDCTTGTTTSSSSSSSTSSSSSSSSSTTAMPPSSTTTTTPSSSTTTTTPPSSTTTTTSPPSSTTTTMPPSSTTTTTPPSSTTTTTIAPGGGDADLSITKTANRKTVRRGDVITYKIKVRNLGPAKARNVVVTDIFDNSPDKVRFVSSSPRCSNQRGKTICRLGTLRPGASVTITLKVKVRGTPGTIVNVAKVKATQHDPRLKNNRASVKVIVKG